MLEFVGVDGEGGDIPDSAGFVSHHYTMLRAGDVYTTGPDWLRFLANQPKKRLYVSYFFDYDVTMMTRHLPEASLRLLVNTGVCRVDQFEIGYRPRKEFYVRTPWTRTTVSDVGTFFQSSFVTALKRWNIGTEAERDSVDDGKENRKRHGALTPQIIEYNALECRLLVELMTKFRSTCSAIGYYPQRWQGPGQLAKAMLRAHQIPKTRDIPEFTMAGIWEAAQAAYYGGRFETSAVGPIAHPVDGWDINSAYPAAITRLPCLRHIEWEVWRRSQDISDRGLYHVDYTHAKESRWYGLPHRTSEGRIIFPRHGRGWYWGVELIAARQLGAQIKVHHGFSYILHCDCRLFDFVYKLYSVRKAVGKSEAGIALKLALNSLYGVFAQSVGDPPYANPIYAGLITATTRATLLDAVALDPDSVYMLATDGIYARPGLPLTPSEDLGGWDFKHYPEGMHVVMPGVYFAGVPENDDDKKTVVRTRGVSANVVKRERERLIAAYAGTRKDGIEVSIRQFIPLRLAVARNALETAGQWIDTTKRIGYDWSTKRRPNILRKDSDGVDRTKPYEQGYELESTPYSRLIGGNLVRDLDRLEFDDAPEWADTMMELT